MELAVVAEIIEQAEAAENLPAQQQAEIYEQAERALRKLLDSQE